MGAVDLDRLDAIRANELREAPERNPRAARDELEEGSPLGLGERPERTPEPYDLDVAVAVAMELN